VVKTTLDNLEKMIDENAGRLRRKKYSSEIERAINNAKRTAWDKWFRRQWYGGRGEESAENRATW
jgi:hypothetical protein